jgi:hypothetical protein
MAGNASAEVGAAWRFAPAEAPPPPPGVAAAPYPVAVGEVGQISFWAPNRGLLITGGTASEGGPVPAGLYAYDGVSWHLLSEVCGGGKGRIAWAGPDDFWTISDQRSGQIVEGVAVGNELTTRSLCHFVNGQIVASYAEPLGQLNSYLKMNAAACTSPDNCWFGGAIGEPPNVGSFHLHWDGAQLTSVYDSSDHVVTGMTSFGGGQIFEGLSIGPEDSYLPEEGPLSPPMFREIASEDSGAPCEDPSNISCKLVAFSESAELNLPVYPGGVAPGDLVGFDLATDGSPLGSGATQLWAGADTSAGVSPADLTILHNNQGEWTQVLPPLDGNGKASASPLGESLLAGSYSYSSPTRFEEPGPGAIAPVPGSDSAWLSLRDPEVSGATVALLQDDGQIKIEPIPNPEEPVGFRGTAGPITCPASEDCWMATSEGWLFHFSDATSSYPQDTDPAFAGVITSRPPDDGLPPIYPDIPPADDSLANQQAAPIGALEHSPAPAKRKEKAKPLVLRVKSRFVHQRVLILSFTLTARARVRLLGRRGKRVVASTRLTSLHPGRHELSLTLDVKNWPTKFQFQAKPLEASGSGGGSGGESGDSISTG